MTRGSLLVFLGAAPGVGKTFAMLEHAHALAAEGRLVVIAVVETHGRAATAALLAGLEQVPLRRVDHLGVRLEELDLEAVLARRPGVAVVDELAHTNAPGSTHGKRWQDVEALLAAGVDVVTTVNVQHVASLNDVVERITGVPQRETVPDGVLRGADRVELVDLAPQALRDRLAAGHVYPAVRVDASLSNYFRLGNLTALRELALLWLADEVDSALLRYRDEQGIGTAWEARERVVVALTGGPEGETLLRRGARVAQRSGGGELLAVHVAGGDGLAVPDPGALVAQRALVEQLGGTFHQIVGDDVPAALIGFARAVNATQLVLGVSRRSRLVALLTGPGTSSRVVRESGDIDVHMVTHAAAGRRRVLLPRGRGALSTRRRALGFAVALVGGPLLTGLLVATATAEGLTAQALAYQLLVILVALVGGVLPASFAAILSGVTLDFLFVQPVHTFTIGTPEHLIALGLYVANGLLVSLVVDQAARRARAAARSATESEVIATIAGGVLRGADAVQALLERTREAFGASAVRLLADDGPIREAADATASADASRTEVTVDDRTRLELVGRALDAADRRVLVVVAAQLAVALEQRALTEAAERLEPLAEVDRVRSALLAAVGHDLRRPLAVATAAVTSLTTSGDRLTDADRAELLGSAERSLVNLAGLVTDLLDVSRVQAGALAVALESVDVDELLPAVLEDLDVGPDAVRLLLGEPVPAVRADPVLLQRVLVNLLANALRWSPGAPELTISAFADRVEVRVIDHGPGVPADRVEGIFQPFQHTADTGGSGGVGLGLALSRGFAEGMGGTLTAERTPGGGLTLVVGLPVDPVVREAA